MKKITLISIIASLSANSLVFAGEMGEADCAPSGFISLEGGYTWNKISGLKFTSDLISFSSTPKNTKTSLRLAAGMIHMLDEQFALTGELGWGYYGKSKFSFPTNTSIPVTSVPLSSEYTLYGFDALIGTAFIQTYYSLYFKAGALIQNMQQNNTSSYTNYSASFPGLYTLNEKHNSTAVLPAIKLGAAYNIDSNWAITGSYLLALGASTGATATSSTTSGQANLTVTTNTQNPATNSFMIGVQYTG
jgi:hypothetical protein